MHVNKSSYFWNREFHVWCSKISKREDFKYSFSKTLVFTGVLQEKPTYALKYFPVIHDIYPSKFSKLRSSKLTRTQKKHASIFLMGVFMSWFPQTKRTREAS